MARTTSGAVEAIIETNVDVSGFITTANLLVNQKLGNSSLSEDMLTEIEKYLAAHLVSIRDPRLTSTDMENASATFEGKNQNGIGLKATQYGQTVIELDVTGTFANLGKKSPSFKTISESD